MNKLAAELKSDGERESLPCRTYRMMLRTCSSSNIRDILEAAKYGSVSCNVWAAVEVQKFKAHHVPPAVAHTSTVKTA